VFLHAPEQAQGAVHVHVVIVQRDFCTLADGLEGCKVDDIVDVGVLIEDGVEGLFVGDVALGVFGSLTADEFDTVENLIGGVVEVVDDDDLVVCLEEGECGEGANVSGAAKIGEKMLGIGLERDRGVDYYIPGDEDRSHDHVCAVSRDFRPEIGMGKGGYEKGRGDEKG
jgi:hypothetical protein